MHIPPTCRLFGMATAALAAALLAACNRAPEAPPMAPAAPTTLGAQVDDAVITSNIQTALLADASMQGMDIRVDTVQGDVQLSGLVDNQRQIDQAAQVAAHIAGANRVKNTLRIQP